jgi:hypothetical protein
MKGRHAVGQQMARPGSIRGGQGAHAANGVGTGHNQKTGVSKSSPSRTMAPRPGVPASQADTSRDLQKRLTGKAPQPFTNTGGAATTAAPTHPAYRSNGNPKELNYTISNRHSICNGTDMSADMMAAVGYGKNDTKGTWSLISGHATKNNQRQAGQPGTNTNRKTSSRENSRMRQT